MRIQDDIFLPSFVRIVTITLTASLGPCVIQVLIRPTPNEFSKHWIDGNVARNGIHVNATKLSCFCSSFELIEPCSFGTTLHKRSDTGFTADSAYNNHQ